MAEPEYLAPWGGEPIAPVAAPPRSRLRWIAGGAAVLAVGGAGAAAWAAYMLLATGAQPAEALPADARGYVAVDLDPGAGQKVEAYRMLRKFPGLDEELDLGGSQDLRSALLRKLADESGCPELDAASLEGWVGDRAAVAVLPAAEGAAAPQVAVVVQVSDPAAAESGLDTLLACDSADRGCDTGAARPGWVVEGDWAVVSETEAAARAIADGAAAAPLSEDEAFRTWTEAAGEPGIVTGYLAPGAGEAAAELGTEGLDLFGLGAGSSAAAGWADFRGAAMSVRFDDGALEVEAAADLGSLEVLGTGDGGAAVASLPADTAAAVGVGFPDGWVEQWLARVVPPELGSVEELLAEVSAFTGLDLPADLETLTGDSLAVAVGPGVDLAGLESGDPSGLPVGVTMRGDEAAIERVLDKLRDQAGPDAELLDSSSGPGVVVVGPDQAYREALLAEGTLGSSDRFRAAVPEAEAAAAVLFVDVDAGEDRLLDLIDDDPQARANLEPLSALGVRAWQDGDVVHAAFRLSTD